MHMCALRRMSVVGNVNDFLFKGDIVFIQIDVIKIFNFIT